MILPAHSTRAPFRFLCPLMSLSLFTLASCGDPACPFFVQFVELSVSDAQSDEPLSDATLRIAAVSPNDSMILNPVIIQDGEASVEFFRQAMCTIELGRGVTEMEATPDTLISVEYSIEIIQGEISERLQGPFTSGTHISGQLFNVQTVEVGVVLVPGNL